MKAAEIKLINMRELCIGSVLTVITYIMISPMSSVYAECIAGDCQDGQGTYVTRSPLDRNEIVSEYEGEWKNGKEDGRGILTFYSNGRKSAVYDGDFIDGKYNGSGNYIRFSENGHISSEYSGEWSGGQQNGHGIYKLFANGRLVVYRAEGIWVNNEKSGNFRIEVFKESRIWRVVKATYRNSIGNGQLVEYDSAGDIIYEYIGELREFDKHGQGRITFSDGGEKKGVWQGDKFVDAE